MTSFSSWLKSLDIECGSFIACLKFLFLRAALWAIAGAFLCLIFVKTMSGFASVAELEKQSYDMGLLNLATLGDIANTKTQPFVFVRIDQHTFEKLNRYITFPKGKMAIYLNNLANSKAKLAIIDLDFSHQECLKETCSLKKAMEDYAKNSQNPPLLLVRVIEDNITEGLGNLSHSVYDEIVNEAPHIHWVSAVFQPSSDGIIRRHKPWVAVCRNKNLLVLPAVHLFSERLVVGENISDFEKKVANVAEKYNEICENNKPKSLASLYSALDHEFGLGNDKNKDRILFLYSPTLSEPVLPKKLKEPDIEPLVSNIDAHRLLKENNGIIKQLDKKIVVFGDSYPSSNDIMHTPLFLQMPGSLVIINSINSILSYGQVRTVYWYETLIASFILSFVSIALVLIFKFFIYRLKYHEHQKLTLSLDMFYEIFIVGIISLFCFIIWIYCLPFLLSQGIWLNIAIPQTIFSFIVSSDKFREASHEVFTFFSQNVSAFSVLFITGFSLWRKKWSKKGVLK